MGELMLSHQCPAVDPVLVQPQIPDPLPPALSSLRVCPDQTPMLLSTQLTLLLQLVSDPSSHSGSRSRSSDREQASPTPISISSSSPYSLGIQLCWLCGVLSHPLCLCILVPLSQSQGAVHRRQKEDGPCRPFLLLQGHHARCLPTASVGALGHL